MMRKTALITGASAGLGLELATLLAGLDYDLVISARGETRLQQAAATLRKGGPIVVAVAGDVADADHRRQLIEAAESLGGLDLLVNNASALGPTPMRPIDALDEADLQQIFEVNVVAPLQLMKLGRKLLEQSAGLVVNISSDAANGGYETWGGYGLSKAALDLASKTAANEWKGRGIGVVSVDPGDMRTAMHQAAFLGEDISDRPLPAVTLPFWAWLIHQQPEDVTGERFSAQSDRWVVALNA